MVVMAFPLHFTTQRMSQGRILINVAVRYCAEHDIDCIQGLLLHCTKARIPDARRISTPDWHVGQLFSRKANAVIVFYWPLTSPSKCLTMFRITNIPSGIRRFTQLRESP